MAKRRYQNVSRACAEIEVAIAHAQCSCNLYKDRLSIIATLVYEKIEGNPSLLAIKSYI